jgi:hypothetical protein
MQHKAPSGTGILAKQQRNVCCWHTNTGRMATNSSTTAMVLWIRLEQKNTHTPATDPSHYKETRAPIAAVIHVL